MDNSCDLFQGGVITLSACVCVSTERLCSCRHGLPLARIKGYVAPSWPSKEIQMYLHRGCLELEMDTHIFCRCPLACAIWEVGRAECFRCLEPKHRYLCHRRRMELVFTPVYLSVSRISHKLMDDSDKTWWTGGFATRMN